MSKWSIPLDRLASKAGLSLEVVTRKATFDVFKAVIYRSPVDTGRFKGNWNVSYGSPDYTTGTRRDSTPIGSGSAPLKALSLPVGGVTYLSNGLPYATRLEYGYSKQAPAGMVRLAAAEFSRFVQRAIR